MDWKSAECVCDQEGSAWSSDREEMEEVSFEFSSEAARRLEGRFCNIRVFDRTWFKVRQCPRKLQYPDEDLLAELCPGDLFKEQYDWNELTCCSPDVLEEMRILFMFFERSFGRCASCMYNLRSMFCNHMCSPRQAQIFHATGERPYVIEGDEMIAIKEIDGLFYETSMQYMFDSCKDVKTARNRRGMDLVCAVMDGDCSDIYSMSMKPLRFANVELWLHLTTQENSSQFEFDDVSHLSALKYPLVACGQAAPYPTDSEPCDCDDCKEESQREGCQS